MPTLVGNIKYSIWDTSTWTLIYGTYLETHFRFLSLRGNAYILLSQVGVGLVAKTINKRIWMWIVVKINVVRC